MSGFINKLWYAVAGDGTSEEHANEPRHAAPSPHQLPPNPFPNEHTRRTNNSISSATASAPTSSASRISIYEQDLPFAQVPSGFGHTPASAERRSVKQHATRKPSDATRAPNPANGYQGPPATKPTSGKGFQPINTIDSNPIAVGQNQAYGHKRPITYSARGRSSPLIGRQQQRGQHQYSQLSRHYLKPSPNKRIKTEHTVAEPVHTVEIESSDEDEIQQEHTDRHQVSVSRPRSAVSSRSPHSTTSKHSGAGSKVGVLPVSEFATTSDMLTPKRTNRRRKKGIARDDSQTSFNMDVPSLGDGSLSQGDISRTVSDDDQLSGLGGLRKAERGVVHQMKGRHEQQHPAGKVTSRHFPMHMMRINESHAEESSMVGSERAPRSLVEKNLHDYRPTESGSLNLNVDAIEVSEDELAPPDTSKSERKRSPLNSGEGSRPVPLRKTVTGKQYELTYVRTHNSKPDNIGLVMRPTEAATIFTITNTDTDGRDRTLHQLNLSSINKVTADNTHCIRMTGSVTFQKIYWYDIKFRYTDEFIHFRNSVLLERIQAKCYIKDEDYMKKLFEHPLKINGTSHQSTTTSETSLGHGEQQLRPQTTLLDQLLNRPRNPPSSAVVNHDGLRESGMRTRARPVRTRQATVSTSAQATSAEEKEVVKFSQTGKLGKPWLKQLDYNVQDDFLKRRRCTVNFNDLHKLDEEEYLNDSLVNFYLLYLYRELNVSVDRVYFFNTYFFDTLTNTKNGGTINYEAVKSWTKRDDVFSYDHIVIPINENFHWYLAIICNVSTIARKPAVEHSSEDSQDLDQMTTHLTMLATTAGPRKEPSAEWQSRAVNVVPAQDVLVDKDIEDYDENLFEEEKKLNLVDADEEKARSSKPEAQVPAPLEADANREALATAALQPLQAKENKLSSAIQKKKKPPAGPRRDPDKPVIMVLDSMGSRHSNATRALREWLEAEGVEKRGMTVEIDHRGHYPKSAQIPMQNNFSDCGLYVLGYARKFFADPNGFKDRLLKGEMSAEADWPEMDASKMRSDIRELILRLYKEQSRAGKAGKAAQAKDAAPSSGMVIHKEPNMREQEPNSANKDAAISVSSAAGDQLHLASALSGSITSAAMKPRSEPAPNHSQGVEKSQTHAAQNREKNMTSADVRRSDFFKEATTDTKPVPPKAPPVGRKISPEVRVAAKLPHIEPSSTARLDGEGDRSRHSLEQQKTDLSSPLRRHRLQSAPDKPSQMLSAQKAQSPLSARTASKRPAPSSPPQPRTRFGSHDDPIPLDDSQDLDAPHPLKKRSPKTPSPEIIELDRSQESIAVPARHVSPAKHNARHLRFDRDDSIQEGSGNEWQYGRDYHHALEASLKDAHGHGHGHRQHQNQRTAAPSRMETQHEEVQAKYLYPPHLPQDVSEAQPMEVDDAADDAVIPESPQPQRASPGQSGDDDMECVFSPALSGFWREVV